MLVDSSVWIAYLRGDNLIEVELLTQPENIFWCDGSEREHDFLLQLCIKDSAGWGGEPGVNVFHAAIAEVAGYPGIWTLIQQVKVHVDRYRRLTLPQQGRIGRVIAEHEAILAAIEAHDPRGARTAIEFHLENLLGNISATQDINPEFFDKRS